MTREQLRAHGPAAMGNMQFMPSTFMKWGVDRDGNGKIDLWTSLPDSLPRRPTSCAVSLQARLPSSEECSCRKAFRSTSRHHDRKAVRAWAAMASSARATQPCQCRRSLVDHPAGRWRGPPSSSTPTSRR